MFPRYIYVIINVEQTIFPFRWPYNYYNSVI